MWSSWQASHHERSVYFDFAFGHNEKFDSTVSSLIRVSGSTGHCGQSILKPRVLGDTQVALRQRATSKVTFLFQNGPSISKSIFRSV
ncbi:hypothetical protein IF2G_00023 [Cordyceps javanica]|nr:hypothetical protein IF2G_00023 [Cordyceps javanica]